MVPSPPAGDDDTRTGQLFLWWKTRVGSGTPLTDTAARWTGYFTARALRTLGQLHFVSEWPTGGASPLALVTQLLPDGVEFPRLQILSVWLRTGTADSAGVAAAVRWLLQRAPTLRYVTLHVAETGVDRAAVYALLSDVDPRHVGLTV